MIRLNNKLVHILTNRISGELLFVADLVRELSDYTHYILFEGLDAKMDLDVIWFLQSIGANVLFVDKITPEVIEQENPAGVILYNIEGHPDIGKVVPTLYYSYGVYDKIPGQTLIVSVSDYNCKWDCHHRPLNLDPNYVIPPAINTRALRYYKKPTQNFTLGLITSGAQDKYPCSFLIELLSKLKGDFNTSFNNFR